jgi:hypothetical protein
MMSLDGPAIEAKIRKCDAHSFTLEGVNDQLEKTPQEPKIIRTLALRNNGKMVRIIRDVRLKARKNLYFTHELGTAVEENTPIHGNMFEYEGFD